MLTIATTGTLNFNSHSPYRERLERWYLCAASLQFQFTFPAWRTISFRSFKKLYYFISRLLHGERLCNQPPELSYIWDFNSRSLCGERCQTLDNYLPRLLFQFSLPAWGAISGFFHVARCSIDFILINSTMISLYFNSCSLCGERCCISKVVHGLFAISILAPCLRSDSARWSPRCSPRYFNSRFRVGSDVCSWQDCFA